MTKNPKGTSIEYCIAYTDPTPHMDGPRTMRQPSSGDLARTKYMLKYLKKNHPDARIQSRIVYPWQEFGE